MIIGPIAAFGVAKRSTKLCVLSPANHEFTDGVDVEHSDRGLEKPFGLIHRMEQAFEAGPVCVVESIGRRHKHLFEHPIEEAHKVAVVNPLQSGPF